MIKRVAAWAAAAVAVVWAVQVLVREGSPPSLVAPPHFDLPGVDTPPESSSPAPSEPAAAATEQRAERAGAATAREPAVGEPAVRPPAARVEAAARDSVRRFVFDCGNGVIFSVRTVPGEAAVSSPQALAGEVITLPQVQAASGARYAQGGSSYWNKGGLATFELRDRTYADCTSSPGAAQTVEARRRRAVLRARGNAPAWALEVSGEHIELTVAAERIDFPYREPEVAGARTTYRTFSGTRSLDVVADRMPCNDSLTGEPFELVVAVTFESATYYGCAEQP